MSQTEQNNELNTSLRVEQDAVNRNAEQLERLQAKQADLKEEGKAAERQAFKNFCKRAKVKQVADFEAQIYPQKQQQVSEGGPSTAAVRAEELNERELPEAESELISC